MGLFPTFINLHFKHIKFFSQNLCWSVYSCPSVLQPEFNVIWQIFRFKNHSPLMHKLQTAQTAECTERMTEQEENFTD